MKSSVSLLTVLIFFSVSCSKGNKSCQLYKKKLMVIDAPSTIYERSELTLNVQNVHDLGINSHYGWLFPDMSPYSTLGGFGLDVSLENSKWSISNVKVQDQGTYTFTASNDECGTFKASKYVEILPLPIPCFNDIEENKLYVLDSASGSQDVVNCTVDLHDGYTQLYLTIEGPMFTYDMTVEFDYLPERASTFYLRNFYENGIEAQVPEDELTQASVAFMPSTATATEYKLIPFTEDIYVKRSGNQITLTLCNVRFKSLSGIKYVSTKVVFDL